MARISQSAAEKFRQKKKCTTSNTTVVVDANGNTSMFLFGNRIACLTHDDRLFITTAGWVTATTFARLREITGVPMSRRGGNPSIGGYDWDGRWIEIINASPVMMISKNDPPEVAD